MTHSLERDSLPEKKPWVNHPMSSVTQRITLPKLADEKKLPACFWREDVRAQEIDESLLGSAKMPASPQRSVIEQNWLEWKEKLLARQREAQKSAQSAPAT